MRQWMTGWIIFGGVVSVCITLAFIFLGIGILQTIIIRIFSVITVIAVIFGLISPLLPPQRPPKPSPREWKTLLLSFLISALLGSVTLNFIYSLKLKEERPPSPPKAPLLSDFQRDNRGEFSFLDPLESNDPNNA